MAVAWNSEGEIRWGVLLTVELIELCCFVERVKSLVHCFGVQNMWLGQVPGVVDTGVAPHSNSVVFVPAATLCFAAGRFVALEGPVVSTTTATGALG